MKVTLRYCALLVVLLTAHPDHALGQLLLYDNFNATSRLLSPTKWFLSEGGNGVALESSVRIDAGKLRMSQRGYGLTNSDANLSSSVLGLRFPNPNSIRAIQADVEVVDFETTECAANPGTTQVQLELRGGFFNTGTPSPGSHANDVLAAIYIVRRVTDPANRLQVEAHMFRCTTANCSSVDSFQIKNLGSINCPGRICPLQTLFIQWEPANNLFRFRRNTTEQTISYVLADTKLPGNPSRRIFVVDFPENCTAARQRGFMEVLIDNVLTD